MRWALGIFLTMLVITIILDSMGIDSSLLVFLFGFGWLGLLTLGVFWVTKKRTCPVCRHSWSIADIQYFSITGLKGLFSSCPRCLTGKKQEVRENKSTQ